MSDCKCLTVKLYEDAGWRCMQCYRQFTPGSQEVRPTDYIDVSWWRKHKEMRPEDKVSVDAVFNAMNAMWNSLVEKHGTG